jgi:hypothetical protein
MKTSRRGRDRPFARDDRIALLPLSATSNPRAHERGGREGQRHARFRQATISRVASQNSRKTQSSGVEPWMPIMVASSGPAASAVPYHPTIRPRLPTSAREMMGIGSRSLRRRDKAGDRHQTVVALRQDRDVTAERRICNTGPVASRTAKQRSRPDIVGPRCRHADHLQFTSIPARHAWYVSTATILFS